MIKKIDINYPGFGLSINEEFNEGINLIEKPNGWGKTTLLNSIHSFFTNKFTGLGKSLPDGTCIINFSNGNKGMLINNKWLGQDGFTPSDLFNYIIPGRFFLESTPKQRSIFTNLLGLDYVGFMKKALPYYYEGIESDLRANLKSFLEQEKIVIEDITNLKSELINLSGLDFNKFNEFKDGLNKLNDCINEYNLSLNEKHKTYSGYENRKLLLINSIKSYKEENISYANRIKGLDEGLCIYCNQPILEGNNILETKKELESLINQNISYINSYEKELIDIEKYLSDNKKIEFLSFDISLADKFGITLPEIDIDEYNKMLSIGENGFNKLQEQLKAKEDKLKEFNTIDLDNKLNEIKEASKMFTEYLDTLVKGFPIQIELFNLLKNGNLEETFNVKYKGIDYKDLSTGNRNLVNLMMAKIFVDNLGLDFILIDEGGTISKDNLDYIKTLSLTYQIIICKATGWELKDLYF